MDVVNIQFNSAGFKALLESDEIRQTIEDTANEICEKANANNDRGGSGYAVQVKHMNSGGGRWGAFVYAKDKKATQAESEDKALTRALNS